MSKTKKKILVEQHLGSIQMESYKPQEAKIGSTPTLGSFGVVITEADVLNANNRNYSRDTWLQPDAFGPGGRYIDESGKVKPLSLIGYVDHPFENQLETLLAKGAIVWTEITENNNVWSGKANILNTPEGKIVKTYMDYAREFGGGEHIGVSTRADGSVELVESAGGSYERVVPDGFYLAAIDFVHNPSVFTANNPTLLESKGGAKRRTLLESIKHLAETDEEHKETYMEHINKVKTELNKEKESITEETNVETKGLDEAHKVVLKPEVAKHILNERYGYGNIEHRTKNMIESILAYGSLDMPADRILSNKYMASYIEEAGDIEIARKWIEEVRDTIESIRVGVSTDSEGVTYNSLVYKEALEVKPSNTTLTEAGGKGFTLKYPNGDFYIGEPMDLYTMMTDFLIDWDEDKTTMTEYEAENVASIRENYKEVFYAALEGGPLWDGFTFEEAYGVGSEYGISNALALEENKHNKTINARGAKSLTEAEAEDNEEEKHDIETNEDDNKEDIEADVEDEVNEVKDKEEDIEDEVEDNKLNLDTILTAINELTLKIDYISDWLFDIEDVEATFETDTVNLFDEEGLELADELEAEDLEDDEEIGIDFTEEELDNMTDEELLALEEMLA